MEKRTMGKTGMEVSVLGFGGAEIGFEKATVENVRALLNAALDAGLNVVDTAECYNNGDVSSEELIGTAIGHRRNDFYLFTKVGHTGKDFGLDDWNPQMMAQSIDRSLHRLKTDCVDLIQLHTCGEDLLRQGDVISVLQAARDAGKTRFIGYSGDSTTAKYACGSGAFDTLQTSVNIADQQILDVALPVARAQNMGVIAKRPIANVAWLPSDNPYRKTYADRLRALDYDFLKTDEAVAHALRFTLSQGGVHTAIVGTTKPDRWKSNAALLDAGPLDAQTVAAIRDRWHAVAEASWVGQG